MLNLIQPLGQIGDMGEAVRVLRIAAGFEQFGRRNGQNNSIQWLPWTIPSGQPKKAAPCVPVRRQALFPARPCRCPETKERRMPARQEQHRLRGRPSRADRSVRLPGEAASAEHSPPDPARQSRRSCLTAHWRCSFCPNRTPQSARTRAPCIDSPIREACLSAAASLRGNSPPFPEQQLETIALEFPACSPPAFFSSPFLRDFSTRKTATAIKTIMNSTTAISRRVRKAGSCNENFIARPPFLHRAVLSHWRPP